MAKTAGSVASEMPKVEGSYNYNAPFDAYGQGVNAECLFLAKQGYRKVPSKDEMLDIFVKLTGLNRETLIGDAEFMRSRLLEGE